jgi:hypothetical protein
MVFQLLVSRSVRPSVDRGVSMVETSLAADGNQMADDTTTTVDTERTEDSQRTLLFYYPLDKTVMNHF